MPTASLVSVIVTFTWDAGPSWSFSGGTLSQPSSPPAGGQGYAVQWQFSTDSASGVAFAATNPITWNSNQSPPALPSSWTLPTGLTQPYLGVLNTNTTKGNNPSKFGYTVAVTYNGNPYTSPDPELVLQPPT